MACHPTLERLSSAVMDGTHATVCVEDTSTFRPEGCTLTAVADSGWSHNVDLVPVPIFLVVVEPASPVIQPEFVSQTQVEKFISFYRRRPPGSVLAVTLTGLTGAVFGLFRDNHRLSDIT